MAQASFITSFYSSSTIGQSYNFKIYSYDSSYLHKVIIKLGSYSMTFDRVKGGVTTSYTIPLTWCNAIPNGTTMNGTITLTTYQSNYSTKVGSNNVRTIKFSTPSNIYPSVSVSLSDELSDVSEKFGAYVQNKSKLNVNVSANGIYGSTIKTYKTTLNGVSYSGESFTTNVLNFSGTYYLTTTVTDSRGKTASTTKTINILPYGHPRIISFSTSRADAQGIANSQGNYLLANVNFTISEVDGLNDCDYSLEYKLKDENSWTILSSGSIYSLNDSVVSSGAILDTNLSYDTRLVIKDYFKEVIALNGVGTSFKLIHFNKNGKALGFGKVSEKDEGVEFGIPTYFDRPLIIGSENKILWEGSDLMTEDQRAELTEKVTEQQNGIALVFSKITNGAAEDNNFQSFFVSKKFIDNKRGYGNVFVLTTNRFGTLGTKYLYVNDTYITGHTDNDTSGTSNGITFNNAAFCLRYVIGI